jgi:translation initiation factor 3 subunit C
MVLSRLTTACVDIFQCLPNAKLIFVFRNQQDSDAFTQAYNDAVTVVSSKDAAAAERATRKSAAEAAGGEATAEDFMTVGRGGRALNLTSDGVFKTLKSIMESRGRKVSTRM